MAQSTEDYLDSLLRQAMGIPDPEPQVNTADIIPDMEKDDVLAMADGLTGSNSAILGSAYDHNASFTNEGEIEIPSPQMTNQEMSVSDAVQTESAPLILPEDMPDPDAPPVIGRAENPDTSMITENLLPDIGDIQTEPAAVEEQMTVTKSEMTESAAEPIADPVVIPEAPVIEPDGNLDIIPQPATDDLVIPTLEEPVIPEPIIEEPILEDPVATEPLIEEPAIEEPAIEEPAIEEPVTEETVPEEPAAPSISIDDLDPNDGNKALDPDMIASLFAGADAEKNVAEEPAIEEHSVGEPAVEETAVEEPMIEEPAAPSISIDDLDPNDSNKALDPDMIAALFANANEENEIPETEDPAIEEPAVEEPAIEEVLPEKPITEEVATEEPLIEESVPEEPMTEETAEETADEETADSADTESLTEEAGSEDLSGGDDVSLEELSIPDVDDGTPLMADQEISDLLSSLGEITGENEEATEEEELETTGEEQPESAGEILTETAETQTPEDDNASDIDLGGIDMLDTDLSAMLDDVTSSLENPTEGEEALSDSSDLNELLGALDDGSGELADIGELLDKDENSELVDPNTETAEALFASDSEEELFDIDNVIDEEEEPKGKKKKKKGGLFGKKKKKDNVEVIGGDEEMLVDPDLLDIPDEAEIQEKKPSFFARLFAKLFEEAGEDEENELIGIEQTAVEIAQEGAEENEAILSELESEGSAKDKKKEKKEKKKKEKKDKKAKGGDGQGEEGEDGSAEPKKKKKEKKKKEKEKLPELPSKKLPRKKVVAISLFCITIGIVITFLAFMYPYSQDMKKAKKYYGTGEYQKTYEYMRGHRLTADDRILYDKTTTLLRIKRPYDSYQNYMKMGLRMEALNALVQGVQMVDKYAEDAASLGIIDKYSQLSRKIYDELYNTFGVTVERAKSWIELEGTPEYTRALYECLLDTSGAREVQEPYAPEVTVPEGNDPVINAEENDL